MSCLEVDCAESDIQCNPLASALYLLAPCVPTLFAGEMRGCELQLTGQVTTLAGNGTAGDLDGVGTTAATGSPLGITTDGQILYVMSTTNNRIRTIQIAGVAVATLAGSTTGFLDGIGTAAQFNVLRQGVTDGTNLFVITGTGRRVRQVSLSTTAVTTFAGSGGAGSADGIGTAATFSFPQGMTSDGNNLYIGDSSNHLIRKIELATGNVTTLAGQAGVSGTNNGVGTAAQFFNPWGLSPSTDGLFLYICDRSTYSIRMLDLTTLEVTTFAGSPGTLGSTDGIGTAARFNEPVGITNDGVNLYVTERANHTIRKINLTTRVVTTLAGLAASDGGGNGYVDDTSSVARFDTPHDIVTDGTALYVADTLNNRIRKIQ